MHFHVATIAHCRSLKCTFNLPVVVSVLKSNKLISSVNCHSHFNLTYFYPKSSYVSTDLNDSHLCRANISSIAIHEAQLRYPNFDRIWLWSAMERKASLILNSNKVARYCFFMALFLSVENLHCET